MNKRGFVKTVEAVIAVVIVLSFIYFLAPKDDSSQYLSNDKIEKIYSLIFNQISINEDYRGCIEDTRHNGICKETPTSDPSHDCMIHEIDKYISSNIPAGYTYICEVCNKAASCLQNQLPVDKSIYADSILIANNPIKIFRIYIWQE